MNLKSGQDFKKYLTKGGWEQLTRGHPWLLKKHLTSDFRIENNSTLAHLGEHWFSVSPKSQITLRRIGPKARNWAYGEKEQNFPMKFWSSSNPTHDLNGFWESITKLFSDTLRYKKSLRPEDTCFRWIFSENDLFPGLIVDVFKATIIVQLQTHFVEDFWPQIQLCLKTALKENTFSPEDREWQLLRNHHFRKEEGLELIEPQNTLAQETQIETWMSLKWKMNPGEGQKTGAFLDQGENHLRASYWANTLGLKSAWDLFSFEGGFGLHLLKDTSAQVTFVDSSEKALENCKTNLTLNSIDASRTSLIKQDVFSFLRQTTLEQPDLIVLDPPSLAKSRAHKGNALNSFRDLNLQAAKRIKPGGLLVSCSCSQVISKHDYLEMLQAAAHGARRSFSILEFRGPSADHSPLVEFTEGDYLQAWYLRVV